MLLVETLLYTEVKIFQLVVGSSIYYKEVPDAKESEANRTSDSGQTVPLNPAKECH
jgi:hypothetical protein